MLDEYQKELSDWKRSIMNNEVWNIWLDVLEC